MQGGALAPPPPPDPALTADVWLQRETVRYGGAASDAAYLTSYAPFTVDGNHTRAVLLLAAGRGLAAPAAEPDEQTLRSLADRIALSCECVVLLPRLSGGTARWQHGRLLSEADAAARYLNAAHGAQALGVVALGEAGCIAAELHAQGALESHALDAAPRRRSRSASLL